MIIAEQLKNKSRIEYLLYMWQVENILRAYACDAKRLESEYVAQFSLDEATRKAMAEWYAHLATMMKDEGVEKEGHLQVSKNIVITLDDLHAQLSRSKNFPFYESAYMKVLPYIVEIRRKNKDTETSEIETCLNVLYGVMLLHLQQKPVNEATQKAVEDITTFLGLLSDYYFKDKEQPLEF
ncbi:MAG: DUF4924 family protein [Bacteroidales bacterium]|nr:DUF4924 family protein [Bacteroidales bacterium]